MVGHSRLSSRRHPLLIGYHLDPGRREGHDQDQKEEGGKRDEQARLARRGPSCPEATSQGCEFNNPTQQQAEAIICPWGMATIRDKMGHWP